MISTYTRNVIVLGLLSAVGPFAIDMYLPALPSIAASLSATTAATQMTLTSFFVAFGICQLIYGPVSDRVGRKPPLYVGLVLFTIGSIGCALAPTVGWLVFFRGVQGAGASAVMVIPRAIVRDMHTGIAATQLMSFIMLVISVSPILAPLIGSALIVTLGWRAVFVAVTVVAAIALGLLAFFQAETLPPDRRSAGFADIGRNFRYLITHRRFLGLTFIGGFGMASFFAFLAGSSFVYIEHFGLTPAHFGLAFAVNAVGFIGGSQFAAKLGHRFGMARVVLFAVTAYAALTAALALLTLAGVDNLYVMMVMLLFGFAAMGLVIPSTMVLALDEHGPIAGMASALGGTLQMVTGGATIVIVSLVFDGTSLPMVGAIALCAIASMVVSFATLGLGRAARAQGAPNAAE
jgi:DHA1 family bicyclomycin/chloramphenicol resistance-like MFS transporter